MTLDALELPQGYEVECDVCIVGAGAAGITIAHELRSEHLNVVLLESGGARFETRTQDLARGVVTGPSKHAPLHKYRQRRFGGTTTVWGGRCAPYDAIDFETRPEVPYSGWPISKQDVDPYYERAHAYCDLGAYTYTVGEALPDRPGEMIPGLGEGEVSTQKIWRFSLPTHFGKKYAKALDAAPNVRILLHANCLKISTTPNGRAVDLLEVATLEQRSFTVRARYYVLAAGGLEVPRLLLLSDDVHPNGIGNGEGLVGKFYISHLSGEFGPVLFTVPHEKITWDYERTASGIYCRRTFSIAEEVRRREGLLNLRAILTHPPVADPRHRNSVLSAMYLAKNLMSHKLPPEYTRDLLEMTPYEQIAAHVANVLLHPVSLLRFSADWLGRRIIPRRKLPSVVFESPHNEYWLHFDAEQSPNAQSRVTLGDEEDDFGLKRLKVDYRYTASDVQSVVRSVEFIADAWKKAGVAHMDVDAHALTDQIHRRSTVGSHHIGTTRMGDSPVNGVVDTDCRVFGMSNLFVSSSSVFPTSSYANPTLHIVALAIRLADHLKYTSQVRTLEIGSTVAGSNE
jgi:choline dehydrogenase-like flavoprotein